MTVYRQVELILKGEIILIIINSNFNEEMVEKSAVKAIPRRGLEGERFFIRTELNSEKHEPGIDVT